MQKSLIVMFRHQDLKKVLPVKTREDILAQTLGVPPVDQTFFADMPSLKM
ncbi:MAG: hypothetical protein WCK86_14200 [Planctomycetia bacterium]